MAVFEKRSQISIITGMLLCAFSCKSTTKPALYNKDGVATQHDADLIVMSTAKNSVTLPDDVSVHFYDESPSWDALATPYNDCLSVFSLALAGYRDDPNMLEFAEGEFVQMLQTQCAINGNNKVDYDEGSDYPPSWDGIERSSICRFPILKKNGRILFEYLPRPELDQVACKDSRFINMHAEDDDSTTITIKLDDSLANHVVKHINIQVNGYSVYTVSPGSARRGVSLEIPVGDPCLRIWPNVVALDDKEYRGYVGHFSNCDALLSSGGATTTKNVTAHFLLRERDLNMFEVEYNDRLDELKEHLEGHKPEHYRAFVNLGSLGPVLDSTITINSALGTEIYRSEDDIVDDACGIFLLPDKHGHRRELPSHCVSACRLAPMSWSPMCKSAGVESH